MTASPLIIDCDPGIDDAIALLLAFANPGPLDLLAITTVAGNVSGKLTEQNARRIRDLAGPGDLPIVAGCPRPLVREPWDAAHVHGETGLDGSNLPPAKGEKDPRRAVEFLIESAAARPGEITLCPVGPLTNIAAAIIQRPEFADEVKEIVIMGGATGAGNVTEHAEFNYFADPHAARVVFESGANLVQLGLDVTHQARAGASWIEQFRSGGKVAATIAGLMDFYTTLDYAHPDGQAIHDAMAVGYLIWPELFETRRAGVKILTDDDEKIGRSEVDFDAGDKNALIVESVDAEAFLSRLAADLHRLDRET